MTNDGSNTLVYDAENRTLSATNGSTSGTYSYDGNNLRVKKVSGSTTTVYLFSGSKVIAEYVNGAAPAAPTREYIYSGGTLLARIEAGATKYYHQDHLSNRLVTDSSGNVSAQIGHYPYGESWYNGTSDKLAFTSYERDSESGNDYALARYYINRLARYSSPDKKSGSTANPQSLNRFAYVLNNPENFVDPSGNDAIYSCTMKLARRRGDSIYSREGGRSLPGEEWDLFLDPPEIDDDCDLTGGGGGGGGSASTDPCASDYTACVIDTAPPDDIVTFTIGGGPLRVTSGGGGNASGDPIGATLQKLQTLLKLDPNCSSFLSSNGTNAQTELSGIIGNHLYGQTEIPPTPSGLGTLSMTNAVSFGYIPGQAITVNTIGAFFNSTYKNLPQTTDRGRIAGGTPAAQGFILLHELGHLTDVLKPDFHNQKVVDQNDKALEEHCKDLIKVLSK